MSTPNTVKAQLQNLIDISNRKTGKSDTDLTGVVDTLNNERDSLLDGSITEFYSDITTLSDYAFARRMKLISVHLPNITKVAATAFYQNVCLKNVIIPEVDTVYGSAFNGCSSLEYIDLIKCYAMGNTSFANCTLLSCFILRKIGAVCSISNHNVLAETKIASGTGYIYVPRDLIEAYKTATNWVTFASQFRALEDYTVDGTIDGELDWDKVNGGTA